MTDSDQQRIWQAAIDKCDALPLALRIGAKRKAAIEEHSFDESYLEFLDTQISLAPRGPEWTERLKLRREALTPYCNQILLRRRVRLGHHDYTIEVLPESEEVVHWERFENDARGPT
jgi:hypothetical protein